CSPAAACTSTRTTRTSRSSAAGTRSSPSGPAVSPSAAWATGWTCSSRSIRTRWTAIADAAGVVGPLRLRQGQAELCPRGGPALPAPAQYAGGEGHLLQHRGGRGRLAPGRRRAEAVRGGARGTVQTEGRSGGGGERRR